MDLGKTKGYTFQKVTDYSVCTPWGCVQSPGSKPFQVMYPQKLTSDVYKDVLRMSFTTLLKKKKIGENLNVSPTQTG